MSTGARETVVERLALSRADFVVLVAPAGYGKTTVAEQFARRCETHATCTGIVDPSAFASRILETLATERPERRLAITESIASANDESLLARTLEFWSATFDGGSIVVLDNVEDVIETTAGVMFLTELLRRCPSARRVVICSRVALPHVVSRYVAPDRADFIDARQLAFTRSDIDRMLRDAGLTIELGESIQRLTNGWPIAVSLTIRLASEGRFDDRSPPTDARYETLLDHFSREYLALLPSRMFDALVFVVAVPGVSTSELAGWLDVARSDLHDFLRSSPFLRESGDGFVSHPLLEAIVRTRYAERASQFFAKSIAAYREAGLRLRAAALEIERGRPEDAAADLSTYTRASGRYGVGESEVFVSLVSAVGHERWLAYPDLWLAMLQLRRFALPADDVIAEARRVYTALRPNDPEALRTFVAERYAIALINYGRARDVDALVDDCLRFISDLHLARRLEINRLGAATYSGSYLAAQDAFRAAASSLTDPAFYGPKLDFIEATIALRRGAYEQGVALLEESVRIVRQSHLTSSLQVTLSNLILEAWLAGDDVRFRRALAELKASLLPGLDRPWTFLLDASVRPNDAVATGFEFASVRCVAHLMIAVNGERSKAKYHAELAVREADASAEISLRIVARIGFAEIVPAERARAVAEAERLAATIDLCEVGESVAAFARGEVSGVFEPFVRLRLRHNRRVASIVIRIGAQEARRNDERVALTTIEYALLVFVVAARRAVLRDALCEALWPDSDLDAAAMNLKVAVHRVRKKLGSDILAFAGDAYLVGSHVTLDLHAAESAVAAAVRGPIDDEKQTELERILAESEPLRSARIDRFQWFEALARRSNEAGRSAAIALLRSNGDLDGAAGRLLRTIVNADPGDEEICDLLVRAYLGAGRPNEARGLVRRFIDEAVYSNDAVARRQGELLAALVTRTAAPVSSPKL